MTHSTRSFAIGSYRSLVLLIAALMPVFAQADQYLKSERDDPSVPIHCRDWKIESFGSVQGLVFYGIKGATEVGFTDEIDLNRHDASTLWAYAKPSGMNGSPPAHLAGIFAMLQAAKQSMGFDYSKEGDVLEALTLQDLEGSFPISQFFMTGGVSYRNAASGNTGNSATLGELDVIVGRRSDCAIQVIGEAKLGVKQINHAREQIKRFTNFAKGKLCRGSDANRLPLCDL